jgi:hypothetical protein
MRLLLFISLVLLSSCNSRVKNTIATSINVDSAVKRTDSSRTIRIVETKGTIRINADTLSGSAKLPPFLYRDPLAGEYINTPDIPDSTVYSYFENENLSLSIAVNPKKGTVNATATQKAKTAPVDKREIEITTRVQGEEKKVNSRATSKAATNIKESQTAAIKDIINGLLQLIVIGAIIYLIFFITKRRNARR